MKNFWAGFEKQAVSQRALSRWVAKRLRGAGMDPNAAHSLSQGYTGLEHLLLPKAERTAKKVDLVKKRLKKYLTAKDLGGAEGISKFHNEISQ